MESNKVFAKGFSFKRNDNAPEFVVGRLSVKLEDAIEFMKANQDKGWINLNIKKAQNGNYYLELDTYQPKTTTTENQQPKQETKTLKEEMKDILGDSLPF